MHQELSIDNRTLSIVSRIATLLEEDAELAVQALGFALREIEWARI